MTLNGTALAYDRMPNPYRTGGVTVTMAAVRAALRDGDNRLVIALG